MAQKLNIDIVAKDKSKQALNGVQGSLSKVKSKQGNKIKLESIATKSVNATRTPNATVPPNSDATKIPKPKNKTIDV